MSDSPQIKGSALLGVLAWTKEHLGKDVQLLLVEKTRPAWEQVFERPIRSSELYPYEAYAALLARLEDSFSLAPTPLSMRDVGRWTGKRDLGGILKIVSVFASPRAVVTRGFGSWGHSFWARFCTAGTVRLSEHHSHGASIALDDFPQMSSQHCLLMEGWWEAMAEAAGAQNARIRQSQCIHRGHSHCEFEGNWS